MARFARLLFAIATLLAMATSVFAHDQYLWYPSSYTLARETTTWRTAGDSFYARANMIWNSTNRSNMLHMATHGYRFTHDVQDANAHVNATGRYVTSLPSPYYDRDAGVNGRYKEGEITAENPNHPGSTGGTYPSRIEFSHWYNNYACGGCWQFDTAGGSIVQTAQISEAGCPICDKWDAADGLADKQMGTTSYPSVSAPAVASALSQPAHEGAASRAAPRPTTQPAYRAGDGADKDEIVLRPDLSSGLSAYRDAAHSQATQLVSAGPARAVMTFSRPLAVDELADFEAMGIVVQAIEAVTTNNRGLRWSMGSPVGPDLGAWLATTAEEMEEAFLGITSANVIVDRVSLDAAVRDERVYLVDSSVEHYARGHKGVDDIVLNDVYWQLAGWAP